MINELQITTRGKVEIVGEYKKKIKKFRDYCLTLKSENMENDKDYNLGFDIKKNIKKGQERIKEIMRRLDDPLILDLKELLLDVNGILASNNTAIDKCHTKFKISKKSIIVENGFENIKLQPNFSSEEEKHTLWLKYQKECLDVLFKGKSDFVVMQNIALNTAEDVSNKLEMQQLKYEKTYNELKIFCSEIELATIDNDIKSDAKAIVLFKDTIEETKNKYRARAESQKQAEKQKQIEAEKVEPVETTPIPSKETPEVKSPPIMTAEKSDNEDLNMQIERDNARFDMLSSHLCKYKWETQNARNLARKIGEIIQNRI